MAYCGPRGIPLGVFLGWDDSDQDAALAWQAQENSRCPECHTHAEDWRPGSEPTHWAPQVCPGCQARARTVDGLRESGDRTRGLGIAAHGGPADECPTCAQVARADQPDRRHADGEPA